ncbi:hypothetical protein MSG28_004791 [Choristoneura fumiferana]|uniref:Uncharacterized protein n=1 Tax=Choristoneura fumiferana TaxID=7141 RepID=A0ACC0K7M6_CHOFU|nr:hypothetical protein MSG28_004791 [Choristoneura fumiferana]
MNAKSATKDKPGRGYTYEQGFKLSNVFSANLRKKFKIKDGDAVAVMLPNIPDYPIVAMGILGAGGVITSINPIYTAHEVQRQLTSSNAKIIVTIPEITDVVKNALKMAKLDLPIIVIRSDETAVPEGTIAFNELSENVNVDLSCLKEVRRTAKDLCFLPYSSGTTGVPKGVQLTNANIVSNCDQINEPIIKSHNETTDSHQDAVMSVLPFFHIYGASVIMFHKMSHGIKLVTLAKFQPEPFLTALEKYKTNIIFVAPPIVLLMASHPASTPATFQYLETIINGAAPLAASDAERLFDKAKRTFDFRQGYGLTETSPVVSLTPKGLDNYACVGVALPSTDLKIVDKDLNTLGPNEKGELLIRGPQVMKGYKDNDKANKETFTEDGWFRSGDLAVDDAAVIGVPHKTNGEAPKAFIVLKKGHSVPSSEVCAFVKERVAEYKRIHDVTFVDSLPKSSTGKILRRELKEKYTIENGAREVDFSQGYGLTETSPLATLNPLNSKEYKTVGFALPNMLMRIVDDKMNNLGPNEVGELLFKGPNVMKGYKKNPEANKNAFTEDGWLRTGDLASINEEGRLTIVDRLKELIKVKGYQVPPAELENVVKQHPAVFDAAVIGISDSYTGEKPKAFVVLKEGVKIDDTKIMDFVNQRVAPYKKIKEISFIDAVPKNNSGKILRRVLKDMHDGK